MWTAMEARLLRVRVRREMGASRCLHDLAVE
jgi:hypothetical protein